MIVINFSHPLTNEQIEQIEALIGQPAGRIIEIPVHLNPEAPFAPQVKGIADRVHLTPREWQTSRLVVVLPGLNVAAALLVAELHGRMGYFPSVVRLRSTGTTPPVYAVEEILNLQDQRDKARQRRDKTGSPDVT